MPGSEERIGLRSRAADRARTVKSRAFLLLLYI